MLKSPNLIAFFSKLKFQIYRFKRRLYKIKSERQISLDNKKWNQKFKNKKYFQFKLKPNLKINLYKDSVLSKAIFLGFEEEETSFVNNILENGDIFIDIGSNVGLFSLIASQKVGKEGKVISFEPYPLTYERLVENTKINSLGNIDVRNLGLSNKKEKLKFYFSHNGYDAWNSFAPSKDDKLSGMIHVPVSTIDFELKEIDKSKVKLVKIDVEGWEKFVLMGGENFFRNYSPLIMVEFTEFNTLNAGYPVLEIYDLLNDWGYDWFRISERTLIPSQKKKHYPYENLIAIKRD